MAVLKILTIGNPILKKVSRPVPRVDKRIKRILRDMADTLYQEKNGVGLAAPQVGINERIVVIDVQDEHGKLELVNPVIVGRSEEEVIATEGCLSVPDYDGDVRRSAEVDVEYYDRDGKKQLVHGTGILSICLQHEIDHLDGVLFVDRAESLMKKEEES